MDQYVPKRAVFFSRLLGFGSLEHEYIRGLPNCVGNGNRAPGQRTVSQWFDASAFAVPSAGQFGNCGVNTLEGPGLSLQNVSVIKEFKISERFRAQLQGLALDLFNTPTFSFPASNISVPGQVGRLNSLLTAGDPGNGTIVSNRFVIMRLRLSF